MIDTSTPAEPATVRTPRAISIERRSIDWIPEDERHGRLWHQIPFWFLGNFNYFSIPIGFIGPALGLSLGWTVLSAALGIVVGTIFMALHATQGPRLGLPQMIQSRAQFGYSGVLIPLAVTLFTYMALNVADQILLSEGFHAAFGWNVGLMAVLVTVLGVVIAIWGHDWVHRAFRFTLALSLPVTGLLSVGVIFGLAHGHGSGHHLGFVFSAFMAEFSACAAYNIVFAPFVSDYTRYLPADTPGPKLVISLLIGAVSAPVWLIAFGAWIMIHLGATDGLLGTKLAGNNFFAPLGTVDAFLMASALAVAMGMNTYGATLTVLTAVDSVKKLKPTRRARVITILVLAVIWYTIARGISSSSVNTVSDSLTLMLYLLVPWTATNLVDFFLVRHGSYAIADLFTPRGIYGRWGTRGLIAFAVGFAAEIPFMVLPSIAGFKFTGPLAKSLDNIDFSWCVGLAVSGVVYWLLARTLNVIGEQEAVERSQEMLEAGSSVAADRS